jgi:hypothetical protein
MSSNGFGCPCQAKRNVLRLMMCSGNVISVNPEGGQNLSDIWWTVNSIRSFPHTLEFFGM